MAKHSKTIESNSLKAAAPLLQRTAAFLGVCILFSGIIGPRVISHGLVGKDGFQIYGGAGKALLFGVIALSILVQRRGVEVALKKWHPLLLAWSVLSAVSLVGAWECISKLLNGDHGLGMVALTHTLLVGSLIFALIGAFGLSNLRALARKYKNELLIALGLSIAFYGFLYLVYGLWEVLAATVLHAVKGLLQLTGLSVTEIPPRTLLLDKFGINIAQYCSGIESIALFTGLYALIGVLDWQRFNTMKYLGVFIPALIVLFGFNILRVYGLILGGYYINPQLAFSLFHTYAGMVFFIIYSGLFWVVSYRWLLQPHPSKEGHLKVQ